MSSKKSGKTKTNIYLGCGCGSKAMIYRTGECRWFAHCPGCGRITFFSSAQVLERVRMGGKLCLHNPKLEPCKDGITLTSWCPICRIRNFVPIVT